ncbi:hypothetical protein [Clostridium tertium]|uniref:hypothetical protein n=1 Tax=Clostridium tertium TaxID=1559 RepID=UPI0023B21CA3|nr:hypothetical protein [Clostridium tertium]
MDLANKLEWENDIRDELVSTGVIENEDLASVLISEIIPIINYRDSSKNTTEVEYYDESTDRVITLRITQEKSQPCCYHRLKFCVHYLGNKRNMEIKTVMLFDNDYKMIYDDIDDVFFTWNPELFQEREKNISLRDYNLDDEHLNYLINTIRIRRDTTLSYDQVLANATVHIEDTLNDMIGWLIQDINEANTIISQIKSIRPGNTLIDEILDIFNVIKVNDEYISVML